MRKGILLLFISLFLSVSSKAQQAQQAQEISLQEAIDIALENNYQLKVARNNVELSDNQVRSEKADYLPSVNASLSGGRSIGRTFNQDIGQIVTETTNDFSGNINADLPIFSGFENLHSLRSSEYSKQSSEQNLQRIRENVIFNTASNYLQFILNRKILEIDRENLEEANIKAGSSVAPYS